MTDANLSCYKATCAGEFRHIGEGGRLYECQRCGAELRQSGVEELAEDDGPVGQLASVLLNGGSE